MRTTTTSSVDSRLGQIRGWDSLELSRRNGWPLGTLRALLSHKLVSRDADEGKARIMGQGAAEVRYSIAVVLLDSILASSSAPSVASIYRTHAEPLRQPPWAMILGERAGPLNCYVNSTRMGSSAVEQQHVQNASLSWWPIFMRPTITVAVPWAKGACPS